MARRHRSRSWIYLLIWAAGFSGCNRSSQVAPQVVYDRVEQRLRHGELIEAQTEAQRAYEAYRVQGPEWAARFRILQAEILIWRGMNTDALVLLSPELPKSLATDEVAIRRKLLQSLVLPQLSDAKRNLEEGEKLALVHQPKLLGEVELRRASLLLRSNDFSAAETSLQKALLTARRQSQLFVAATAENNLAFVAMRRQHYGEAVDWGRSALALSESLGARALVAKILGNLGWCYYKMGDLDAALDLFMKAQSLSNQLGLRRDELRWFTNIGNIHYDLQEFDEAQSYYRRALTMAEELDDRSDWAICLANLAVASIQKGRLEEAEQYNQQAVELGRLYKDPLAELHYVYNKGRIAIGQGRFPEAKALMQRVIAGADSDFSLQWLAQAKLATIYAVLKQPELADQEFRKSLATIGEARSSLNREEYRLSFLANAVAFYDDYLAFLVGRGKIKEALHVVELNRARTLAEGLGVRQEAGLMHSAAFQPEGTARRTRSVILSYWLGRERSYLWLITPSQVQMFLLPPQSEIEQAVRSYRAALAGPRDVRATGDASGEKLYEMLLVPAQKLVPGGSHVIIIPDGALHELNFETLLVPADPIHYWVEDVVVANASSLLLLESRSHSSQSGQKNLLLIGDPVPTSAQYTTLPQAASEIDQIKSYFSPDRVEVRAGLQATAKAYLESDPGRFSFIHFVAHGVASRQSPLDSAVILSGDESSYKLYAREILRVPLRARLVTISSCEGARGRTYAGEGLVGLSWAFLRAGAHQVVAALWEVNDAATPEFMHQFYAGISAGSEPAVALRTAKLAMLHSDTIYRRPFYWAPFQLYQGR